MQLAFFSMIKTQPIIAIKVIHVYIMTAYIYFNIVLQIYKMKKKKEKKKDFTHILIATYMDFKLPTTDCLIRKNLGERGCETVTKKALTRFTPHINT